DTNGISDIFVHDRATGITERASLTFDGQQTGNDYPTPESVAPSLTADGSQVVFVTTSYFMAPGLGVNARRGVYSREPDTTDVAAARTANGRLDDTILGVLDAHTGAERLLCPATKVAVAGRSVAFLRPEAAGGDPAVCPPGPDLDGDGAATH